MLISIRKKIKTTETLAYWRYNAYFRKAWPPGRGATKAVKTVLKIPSVSPFADRQMIRSGIHQDYTLSPDSCLITILHVPDIRQEQLQD